MLLLRMPLVGSWRRDGWSFLIFFVAALAVLGGLGMLIFGLLSARWKWAMRGAGLFFIGIVAETGQDRIKVSSPGDMVTFGGEWRRP